MSELLVIHGTPKQKSLYNSLEKLCKQGAVETGSDVKTDYISELVFEINFKEGYGKHPELESNLKYLQIAKLESPHLAIISPAWWEAMPEKLRKLFNRVFLLGFAYQLHRAGQKS